MNHTGSDCTRAWEPRYRPDFKDWSLFDKVQPHRLKESGYPYKPSTDASNLSGTVSW